MVLGARLTPELEPCIPCEARLPELRSDAGELGVHWMRAAGAGRESSYS
jgi:hypothetical protein